MQPEALDHLAESSEAAFAIDRTDRIVFWNRGCEQLLGFRAEDVLGHPCWEITGGRDIHGNIHCYSNCPVIYHARATGEPVHVFTLACRTKSGARKPLQISTILVPSVRTALGTIVHIIRMQPQKPSPLERILVQHAHHPQPPLPLLTPEGRVSELTRREKEILVHLAKGSTTTHIAGSLGISPVTVRNHVQNILEKLDVHTKFAAVAFAYQNGLV